MFAKFKSVIYNVVGGFDPAEGGAVGNLQSVSLEPSFGNIPAVTNQNRLQAKEKTTKFPYGRPRFLQFETEDEILVTADHAIRPIICPRDISKLPWNTGYAETINAGKSKWNEDQAAVHAGVLTRCVNRTVNGGDAKKSKKSTESDQEAAKSVHKEQFMVSLPYYYFGVFDGHAGWGAAVAASLQLQKVIHDKLTEVVDLIIPDVSDDDPTVDLKGAYYWSYEKTVSPESAVIGALEQAFWTMDEMVAQDRLTHKLSGGCTACVALYILGKVFVSNAGDSRATIAFNGLPVPMSFDFTPETETQRIRKLGARHPELLGKDFTHLEYLRRPLKQDLGKKAAYRDHYMKGWALKTITEDDLKYPLVCGEGKRSRVLATIGVTRGFGDHDLKAPCSGLPIKPFLSPEPEVKVFDLEDIVISDRDVLILGTDGLWDITSNEKAVEIACHSLSQFPTDDPHRYKYRYTSAAHDLVLHARGRLKERNWRTTLDKHATIDDISVFVIPLKAFKEEFEEWQRQAQSASAQLMESSSTTDVESPDDSNGVESAVDIVLNHQEGDNDDVIRSSSPIGALESIPNDDVIRNSSPIEALESLANDDNFSHPLVENVSNPPIETLENELLSSNNSSEAVIGSPEASIAPVDDYFKDNDVTKT